ncbi:hypothetical protein MKEN_01102600 [Mycena kentingensis (nom. inval.)]|nr:hypothetical protein MKEN_01102600 [Mycena kentingensis (nom. inval.)]
MYPSLIPRAHAFAYSTSSSASFLDDLPPWAPALFPQALPTDVVSLDAASSVWIEGELELDDTEPAEVSSALYASNCTANLRVVPWLDNNFDAQLLAELDPQLLFCPEEAFAEICWAAAVHDVDPPPKPTLRPSTRAPAPVVPDAHPPLADVTNRKPSPPQQSQPVRAQPRIPRPSTNRSRSTPILPPAPPYIPPSTSAVDAHNRLLGAPFAGFDFAPMRRRDVASANGDPTRIDPFPRHLQPHTTLDAAAALLMLQPAPAAHWHVSGSVSMGANGGAAAYPYPTPAPSRSNSNSASAQGPKPPSRFLSYLQPRGAGAAGADATPAMPLPPSMRVHS